MDVIFFNSKVRDDLRTLDKISLNKSVKLIGLLRTFGNTLSMPYSKKISNNLFELRVRGQQEVRIFYCFNHDKAVIIHHFIKKSQKTPKKEIEVALSRIAVLI
jgi:phage-related protein